MQAIRLTENYHRAAAVALLVVVGFGVYSLIDGMLATRYRFYRDHVEELQDRLQRLNSMLATGPELEARIRQVRADSPVDLYTLKPAPPPIAATELQQQVKDVVESNGGNLVSTQILPANVEGGFTKVTIRVQMTSDTEALQKVLYDLESHEPLLFIDNLQVRARPVRQPRRRLRGNAQPPPEAPSTVQLTTRFELAGFMRGKGGKDGS
jgi:general secretion pathway protein M